MHSTCKGPQVLARGGRLPCLLVPVTLPLDAVLLSAAFALWVRWRPADGWWVAWWLDVWRR